MAATAAADAAMTGLIGKLFAVAEAYPELRASENFQQLQAELSSIETELQSSRRYYNATARDLNTRIQSFPDLFFAKPLGFARGGILQGRGSSDPERAENRLPEAA